MLRNSSLNPGFNTPENVTTPHITRYVMSCQKNSSTGRIMMLYTILAPTKYAVRGGPLDAAPEAD